jgi:hypothetical protein
MCSLESSLSKTGLWMYRHLPKVDFARNNNKTGTRPQTEKVSPASSLPKQNHKSICIPMVATGIAGPVNPAAVGSKPFQQKLFENEKNCLLPPPLTRGGFYESLSALIYRQTSKGPRINLSFAKFLLFYNIISVKP